MRVVSLGTLLLILFIIYVVWLIHGYHNPPLSCYLTGCHFTLFGWETGQ